MKNGNTHKDPSCLAFLVGRDGKVVSKCERAYSASSFSKWLAEEVKKYEKNHPRTRMPFVSAKPADLEEARETGKPMFVVFRCER